MIPVLMVAIGFDTIESSILVLPEDLRLGIFTLLILLISFWVSIGILSYYQVLRKVILPDIKFWNMNKQYMGKIRELGPKGNYEIWDENGALLSSLEFNSFGQKRFLNMNTADNRQFTSNYKYLNRPEGIYHEVAYRDLHSELRIVDSSEKPAFYVKTGVTRKQFQSYRIQNDLVKIYDPRSVFTFALAALCCLFHIERQDFRRFIISPEDSDETVSKSTPERYFSLPFSLQVLFLPIILIHIPILIFFAISKVINKSIIRVIYYGFKSPTWPTTQGEVVATSFSNGSGARTFNVYYEYQVNLQDYHSKRRVFGYQNAKRNDAIPLTEKYLVGKPVHVYYHPSNPGIAVLESGIASPGISTLVFDSLIYGSLVIPPLLSLLLFQWGAWVSLINISLILTDSPPIPLEMGFSFDIVIDPSWILPLFLVTALIVLIVIIKQRRRKNRREQTGLDI